MKLRKLDGRPSPRAAAARSESSTAVVCTAPGMVAAISGENTPYTKLMCANIFTDQAAAVLLCSPEAARAAGEMGLGALCFNLGGYAQMAERVAAFGGDLEVGPRPGGGFRVAARLPLAADRR